MLSTPTSCEGTRRHRAGYIHGGFLSNIDNSTHSITIFDIIYTIKVSDMIVYNSKLYDNNIEAQLW